MNPKQKRNLIRIVLAAMLTVLATQLPLTGAARLAAFLVPYLVVGYDVLFKAVRGIVHWKPLDECLLMTIATLGALALAVYEDGDYTEAIAVMLFYQVGEWFQSYAVGKSRGDITALMDIRPDVANVEKNGTLSRVNPVDVHIGTTVIVQPGEKVPLDGVVLEGSSMLDTVALTGESVPRAARVGDTVLSGCINQSGVLRIRTTKAFGESTASKILALVEEASSRKSHAEAFIARFARVYTPIVVSLAVALALLPPLVRMTMLGMEPVWGTWIYRALTFLVISCPCALVISIPLSFFAGLGGASRAGVLVKGSNYLEALAQVDTVVFDKTGTLTKGVFEVTDIHPEIIEPQELLHLAAHVERFSTHPIATSLKTAYRNEADGCTVENVEELAGKGVHATVNGHAVYVGNAKLMDAMGAKWHPCEKHGTIVHVAMDGKYIGHIVIADVVKEHAADAVAALQANGVAKTVMLTGDERVVAADVARELGIDEYHSELLPQDKVAHVEALLAEKQGTKGKLAFVGDGINDAPVLARADVGIAMGAMGSDAAIEAADVVLMDDDPAKLPLAMRIAKKTMRIVHQNIVGAIGIKVLVLLLGALGLANMWAAIFADVGVMVLAVFNAMRAMFGSAAKAERSANGRNTQDDMNSYRIEVDCADCANKMERAACGTRGVKNAVVNFMLLKMNVEFEEGSDPQEVMPRVRAACKAVEDDCEVYI